MDGKTAVPNHLIVDPKLGARELHVLIVIHHYCEKYNQRFCWPTQEKMAEKMGVTTETVKKALRRLVEKAYIGKMKLKNIDTGRPQLVYYPTTWINGSGKPEPNNPHRAMPLEMYYKTPHWKATSKAARERAGGKCQVCSTTKEELNAHHNTYDRRGEELPEDLVVLCKTCHHLFHSNGKLRR